jgi:type IV pilus assembly protein PilW
VILSPRARRAAKGYTLVEIMIALALGALLLAGSLEIYSTARASWADQRLGAVVVENGRVMSQVLRSSFSGAGYWGCLPDSNDKLYLDITPTADTMHPYLYANESTDASGLGISRSVSSDIITIYSVISASQATTCAVDPSNAAACPAEIVLNGGDAADRQISFNADGHSFSAGDTVVLSNCSQATAVQVAAVNSATVLTYEPTSCGTGTPGCTYAPQTSVMKLDVRRFYVADNGRGGNSFYLQLNPGAEVELVEGIENFNMRYGIDAQIESGGSFASGSDGSVEQYVSRSNVGGNWDKVLAVKFEYTITSLGNNPVTRDFSTVATIRNFRRN